MRKVKGEVTMLGMIAALVAVVLAVAIYFLVYGTARNSLGVLQMATASRHRLNPPIGAGISTRRLR